jgi:hypothetical protein
LVFPAIKMAKEKGLRAKAQTELKQIETAIDSYKAKYGHYPPDNPGIPALNQLFYELHGTTNMNGTVFQTLDRREQIPVASVSTVFGAGVAGFVNCSRAGNDELAAGMNFLPGLKAGQYGFASNSVRFAVLTTSVPWPKNLGPVIAGWPDELNPIRYNSSSPTNNPKSYDLWVNIFVGGKTNRISNWSAQPEFVNVLP